MSSAPSYSELLSRIKAKEPEQDKSTSDEVPSFSELLQKVSPKKEISKPASLVSAAVRGLGKGALETAESFLRTRPLATSFLAKEYKEKGKKGLEELLPHREGFLESALERGTEMIPQGVPPIAALGMGFAGETAKEAGFGPLGQTVAEIASGGLPSLAKKIVPTRSQKKFVDFAQNMGMTAEEIAPLLPEGMKKQIFSKFATKGESVQQKLEATEEGIGRIYQAIRNMPEAQKFLGPETSEKFLMESAKIAKEMPVNIRMQVSRDAMELIKDGLTPNNLINFYQDISSRYNIGKKQLQRLKIPIKEALKEASPELAHDFEMTNYLYHRSAKMRDALRPRMLETFMDLGEIGPLAYSVVTGSFSGIAKFLGIKVARKVAGEFLTNPRFQNLRTKIFKAIVKNDIPLAKKLTEEIIDETKD